MSDILFRLCNTTFVCGLGKIVKQIIFVLILNLCCEG